MKTTEVKTGDIVYYNMQSTPTTFTVTYKVIEPGEKSVVLEVIEPAYLAGIIKIKDKDFEKFYSK